MDKLETRAYHGGDYHNDESKCCRSQFQFCNPNLPSNSSCTPLGDPSQYKDSVHDLWKDSDKEYLNWTMNGLDIFTVDQVVTILGSTSLLATENIVAGMKGVRLQWSELLDYQWELEVENWFKIGLAALQQSAVDRVARPRNSSAGQIFQLPPTADEKYSCANQKIRSTTFTNFSLFWLIFVLSLGGLIIILSFAIPSFYSAGLRKCSFRTLEWERNDYLELQTLLQGLKTGQVHRLIGSNTEYDPLEPPLILGLSDTETKSNSRPKTAESGLSWQINGREDENING
jgi:hypothetical protein